MRIKIQQFEFSLVLIILLVVGMTVATFIEAAKGVSVARNMVYNSTWFEVLLALLSVSTIASLFHYRSFSWSKITVPLFHLAFVLILIGAFFTRYTGLEGFMSIREGESSNQIMAESLGPVSLPFNLYLEDFVLERYPGSNSPSSYSSHVIVNDDTQNKSFQYHIYMNHILQYRGWRFFQTSYDQDEKGTYLTVSRDVIGTPLTYSGYFLAMAAMLLSLFLPGTFFSKQLLKFRKVQVVLVLTLLFPLLGKAQIPDSDKVVPRATADEFGKLLVQDPGGRIKTLNTLNNEFMRKVFGREQLGKLTPDQVVLSMMTFPDYWREFPLIIVKNSELQRQLEIKSRYLSLNSLYNEQGQYILAKPIGKVFMKPPGNRDKTDKALIELDDKANILIGFISGSAFAIFPVEEAINHKWHSLTDAYQFAGNDEDSLYLRHITELYTESLRMAMLHGDFSKADDYLLSMKVYQEAIGQQVYPSKEKIRAELFYNRIHLFQWLKGVYGATGFLFLLFFFLFLFRESGMPLLLNKVFFLLSLFLLALHTFGIGLRWYIGGFVPLSNAYETMLFISWTALLTGTLVARKQPVALALAYLVGFTFLFVAGLNNSNPEIGNLVPVLKSPWLSIHVAVITSSYALFALVALAAFVNLVLFMVINKKSYNLLLINTESTGAMMQLLLIAGLYTLTAGTLFGAIWANESWGRYWGWDPKETWALISILVYAFVSHIRLIPSMKDLFWFNLASFWAIASILMTFFGVNYFLSGMHSYAGTGDAQVPNWLFWVVLLLILLSLLSGHRYFKNRASSIS
jgi:cytochrome c-type biogenesis protein CcsB